MATVSVLMMLRGRSLMRLFHFVPVCLNNNKRLIENSSISRFCSTTNNVSAKTKDFNKTDVSKKAEEKDEEKKIMLMLPDKSLLVTDLASANKLSKKHGLILVKVEEIQKTGKPLYKLVHQVEHLQEEFENDKYYKENAIKSLKTIQISSKISPHDLQTKLKNINKLLSKNHKVRIILLQGPMQDRIIKAIEVSAKSNGTIQKLTKSSCTIFTITPVTNVHSNDNLCNVDENENR